MILNVQRHVHDAISDAIRRQFGVADLPPFAIEVPPNRALGDLAVTVAFQLARTLRKAPRAIAQELAGALGDDSRRRARRRHAERLPESLSRSAGRSCCARLRGERRAAAPAPTARPSSSTPRSTRTRRRTSATCATPRSATRSCACSRSAARRSKCRTTSTTLGVQVADVIVGFRELEQQDRSTTCGRSPTRRGSITTAGICTRASPNGTTATRSASPCAPRRCTIWSTAATTRPTWAPSSSIASSATHLQTMARLNIGYDLLTYEGDILRLHFWSQAFEILKAQGAVFLQTEGRLAGCWVMRIEEGSAGEGPGADIRSADDVRDGGGLARKSDRALERRRHLRRQGHRQPVLEVRPARPRLPLPPVRHAGRTAARCGRRPRRTAIRRRRRSAGAAHLQRDRLAADVPAGAAQPGAARRSATRTRPTTRSISPTRWWRSRTRPRGSWATRSPTEDAAEAVRRGVGPQGSRREDRRPARSAHRARRRPKSRSATRSSRRTNAGGSASQIAVAAIRYFMLKFSRGKLIVFDIEEALSFEGETGPVPAIRRRPRRTTSFSKLQRAGRR